MACVTRFAVHDEGLFESQILETNIKDSKTVADERLIIFLARRVVLVVARPVIQALIVNRYVNELSTVKRRTNPPMSHFLVVRFLSLFTLLEGRADDK
jgi:uncharacterized ion transporter superfamily protein YfcC